MAWHRRLRRESNFVKLLGTGSGRTFTPNDANPHQWGILVVWPSLEAAEEWQQHPVVRAWNRVSSQHAAFVLRAISVHGTWSRQQPFVVSAPSNESRVVAITRARIKNRKSRTFWRSVPPVTTSLHSTPGLIAAIGIGEAPIGLQGTFSLWEDSASLRTFAYQGPAHQTAIERTQSEQWYAEELFARFEVVSGHGRLMGQPVHRAR